MAQVLFLHDIELVHAPFVQRYAADKLIADTTAAIPHPYPDCAAEDFIKQALRERDEKRSFVHAVMVEKQFVGVASLFNCQRVPGEAEVGYWIGVPFWGRGYATQALSLLLETARVLGFTTLVGKCVARNPASARVMGKNGFSFDRESVGCGRHTDDTVLEFKRSL